MSSKIDSSRLERPESFSQRFVSLSIQHLVHEIGTRMLERYPALTEISFEAQNRTLDLAEEDATNERRKVYTDPRPPYGRIGLTMRRG